MTRLRRFLLHIAVLLAGGWTALALWLSPLAPLPARPWLAGAAASLTVLTLLALIAGRRGRPAVIGQGILFLAVLAAFLTLQPRDDRVWQADMARTPTGELDGDLLTIRNVRNFAWTAEWQAETRWEDRTVDLRGVEGVDLVASYWMGPHIAHLMLSFRFTGALPLIVSIEIRKEDGEAYSALGGFFRQFELIYVVADERDLIGARTSFRGEDVFLFPLDVSPEGARLLLLDYVAAINRLAAKPAWYNTLLTNCTTQIRVHANAVGGALPWSWKILLSGHAPEYAYDHNGTDHSLPFEELRRRARVNDAAVAAAGQPDFSQRIRSSREPVASGANTRP